jgi:putative addiction module component (TIGR02574 family)
MDPVVIRLELHDYIDKASDKKVGEIFAMIRHEENESYEWWKDEELVAELERRSADLKSGKDKGVPWQEVKQRLMNK